MEKKVCVLQILCFCGKTLKKKSSHLILKVQGTLLLSKGEKYVHKKDSASKIRKDLFTEKLDIKEKTMLL